MQKISKQTAEKIHKNVTACSTLYIGDCNTTSIGFNVRKLAFSSHVAYTTSRVD
jgi:hypothetical protein